MLVLSLSKSCELLYEICFEFLFFNFKILLFLRVKLLFSLIELFLVIYLIFNI